jgi:ribosomal protein S18 acetylase RimI-like enzyme
MSTDNYKNFNQEGTPMDAHIRITAIEDVDKLIKLRFDYFAAENWEIASEQVSQFETTLYHYYANHIGDDFFAVIAELDADIVSAAFMAIQEFPANPDFPSGKTGTILNVLTYSDYRRRGYATAVIGELVKIGREQNLSYIELVASEMGKPLYEKLGFHASKPSDFTPMKLSLI